MWVFLFFFPLVEDLLFFSLCFLWDFFRFASFLGLNSSLEWLGEDSVESQGVEDCDEVGVVSFDKNTSQSCANALGVLLLLPWSESRRWRLLECWTCFWVLAISSRARTRSNPLSLIEFSSASISASFKSLKQSSNIKRQFSSIFDSETASTHSTKTIFKKKS